MKDSLNNYIQLLQKLGIEHEIVEHPELKTPPEVLGHLGLSLADGLSTLVMKSDDSFIAVIRRDDCKIDSKKIKKLIGAKSLRMATAEEFEQVTNLPVGTARPYMPEVSRTLIDRQIFEKQALIGGSGSFVRSLRYKTSDLAKLPNSEVVNISERSKESSKRVLSGVRATGRLHLGNYLGAIKGMLALQEDTDFETLYMVADLHAVTTPYKVEELRKNRREIILDYLAAGLDPEKSILFQQSTVPQHAELTFYLASVMTIARMQHLPTFKDKVKQYPENATMALLNYPLLMAADILLYKADCVPVGIDQEPHLEIAREIARKMNQEYGMDFPEPQRFKTVGEYIPSLLGAGKMSKSVEGSYINLTDNLETIKKKIAKIPTDSGTIGGNIPMEGGVGNLFTLFKLFLGKDMFITYVEAYREKTIRYSEMKEMLTNAIYTELQPFQEKRKYFVEHPEIVDQIITDGNSKAQALAEATVREVREKMGLL